MGTRINALFDHDLADFHDREECLARLAPTAPAASAVDDYWCTVQPERSRDEHARWQAEPVLPRGHDLRRYIGPGGLYLTVTPVAARVRTGGRWRGFLTIEPLRRVHLAAFRAIARALGADRMAVCLDSDEVDDLFWDGGHLRDCEGCMRDRWGPPQASIEWIDPAIVAAAETCPPPVWFSVEVER